MQPGMKAGPLGAKLFVANAAPRAWRAPSRRVTRPLRVSFTRPVQEVFLFACRMMSKLPLLCFCHCCNCDVDVVGVVIVVDGGDSVRW